MNGIDVKTEDLIARLADSADAVRPLHSPRRRFMEWLIASVACSAAVVVAFGLRSDFAVAMSRSGFVAIAMALVVAGVSAGAAAFVLSVPGAERSIVGRWIPIVAAGAWIALLGASLISGGGAVARLAALDNVHVACLGQIAGISLASGVLLVAMLRRAAPLQREWAAGLAALAAVALAAAAAHVMCPIDDPAHHLVGHVLRYPTQISSNPASSVAYSTSV